MTLENTTENDKEKLKADVQRLTEIRKKSEEEKAELSEKRHQLLEMTEVKDIERVSPSMVISFLGEYDKWFNNYVMKVRVPNNIYFETGTAVHEFKEEFFKDFPRDGETIKQYASRKFNELWKVLKAKESLKEFMIDDEEVNPQGYTYDEIKEWLIDNTKVWVKEVSRVEKGQFKRSGDMDLATGCAYKWNKPCQIEEHCEAEFNGVKVHGYIDAVYSKDNFHNGSENLTFELHDYKTSSKNFKTVPTDYYLQLMIYALMYKAMKNKVEWITVDYLKYSQKYFFKVTDDAMNKIQQLLIDVKAQIDMITADPKKYLDKPPKKLRLTRYL